MLATPASGQVHLCFSGICRAGWVARPLSFGRRIRRYHVSGVQTWQQSVHRFMCWNSAPARSMPRFPHSGQFCPAIHQSMTHPASAVIDSVSGASRTSRGTSTPTSFLVCDVFWLRFWFLVCIDLWLRGRWGRVLLDVRLI